MEKQIGEMLTYSIRRITDPIIIGDHIAVGDFDGYIHLLNSETGIVEGRAQITSGVPIGKNIHSIGDNQILGIDLDGNVFYVQVKNISGRKHRR